LERLEELGSLERWGIVAPAGAGARGTREFSGGLRPVGRAMTPPFLRHEALRLGRLLTLVGASRLRGRRVAPARSALRACAVGALRLRGRRVAPARSARCACAVGALRLRGRRVAPARSARCACAVVQCGARCTTPFLAPRGATAGGRTGTVLLVLFRRFAVPAGTSRLRACEVFGPIGQNVGFRETPPLNISLVFSFQTITESA